MEEGLAPKLARPGRWPARLGRGLEPAGKRTGRLAEGGRPGRAGGGTGEGVELCSTRRRKT